MTVLVESEPSMINSSSKKSSNNSTRSTKLFITSHRWWLHWLSKGDGNPWSNNLISVVTGKRVAMTSSRLVVAFMSGYKGFLWTRWVFSFFSRWWWFSTSTKEEYSTKAAMEVGLFIKRRKWFLFQLSG